MSEKESKPVEAQCQGDIFPKDMFRKWKAAKLGRVVDDFDIKDFQWVPNDIKKAKTLFERFDLPDLFIAKSRASEHHYILKQGYQIMSNAIYEYLYVFPRLTSAGLKLYFIIKMLLQVNVTMVSVENLVTVRLNHKELQEHIPSYDFQERTFRSAKAELIKLNLIQKIPNHRYDYFINFSVFFCGNRDKFIEAFEYSHEYSYSKKKKDENENKMDQQE